ncbi:hypothetical protein KIW84_050199 [Lathyrus oleraceus]|uniref:Zinc knuckle CX2CX4HX4C domain-containing protein n=1 Tax=Pisum sativum TaxID=3888 RepID=A0A9D5AC34_PEA|nr:hypothetical protein KIW84_050199 [Pisum sativum]
MDKGKRLRSVIDIGTVFNLYALVIPTFYLEADCCNTKNQDQPRKFKTIQKPKDLGQDDEEDDDLCVWGVDDVHVEFKDNQLSIMGKLLSEKSIHKQFLIYGLSGIWCDPMGLELSEIEPGLYKFSMNKSINVKMILKGFPWIFRNNWLVVKPWNSEVLPKDLEFNLVPLWVQIWGIPHKIKTRNMGTKISAKLVKPLKPWLHLGNPKEGTNWVNFRYEKLHTFCFNYGNVGHNEEFCLKENTKLNYPKGKNPFGRWLRSFEYGKRIKDPNDRAYSNNLMNSPSYGDFSPIPEVVLKKLGKLHITDNQQGETEDMQGSSSKVKHSEVEDNNFQQGESPKQPHKRICLANNSKISSEPVHHNSQISSKKIHHDEGEHGNNKHKGKYISNSNNGNKDLKKEKFQGNLTNQNQVHNSGGNDNHEVMQWGWKGTKIKIYMDANLYIDREWNMEVVFQNEKGKMEAKHSWNQKGSDNPYEAKATSILKALLFSKHMKAFVIDIYSNCKDVGEEAISVVWSTTLVKP